MPIMLSGTKNGVQWSIQGRLSHDKRFYALVTAGDDNQLTDSTYLLESRAELEAKRLLTEMLVKLSDGQDV